MLTVVVSTDEASGEEVTHEDIVWVKVINEGALLLKTNLEDINYGPDEWDGFSVVKPSAPEPELEPGEDDVELD